jgi:Putative adhesin
MRAVTGPGRWIWGVSGLVTAGVLVVPTVHLLMTAGQADQGLQTGNVSRTVTVSQPVTSVTVQSYGASIQVTGARVSHVEVTEWFTVPPGSSTPRVAAVVRDGQLRVGSSGCAGNGDCSSFALTVPRDMTVHVASQGGPVEMSGVAAVSGDSGGGSMDLIDIDGPVDVTTDGGPLQLGQVTGQVDVDSGGGSLDATAITAGTATVSTDGGPAQLTGSVGRLYVQSGGGSIGITLTAPADTVALESDSGPASLAVPGGPYRVAASSDGGPVSVTIPNSATATRSITVTTGGGSLQIQH